jgi:membrane associated rhomboid family serine protease
MPGISWQGHLGGLFAGGAIASVYANTRGANQQTAQKIGVLAVAAIFIALAIYKSGNLAL